MREVCASLKTRIWPLFQPFLLPTSPLHRARVRRCMQLASQRLVPRKDQAALLISSDGIANGRGFADAGFDIRRGRKMMGTLALLHLGSRLLSTNHDLLSTSCFFFPRQLCDGIANGRGFADAGLDIRRGRMMMGTLALLHLI